MKSKIGNLQRQLHFHQQSHPDFPATEPDDRVNGMAARAVHVDEVNPEKSAPLGGDAGGIKKWKPLIYKDTEKGALFIKKGTSFSIVL
jgi:hypothetical protein